MWQWQLRTLAGWRLDRPSRRPKVHAEDATCMENPPAEDRLRSAKDCNCTRPADKRTIGGFLNLANDCRNLHCDENWGPISENYHRTFRKTGKNYENCKVEVRCEENDRTVFPKLWRVSRSVLSVHRILAIFAFFFMVIPPQCSASFDGQVLPWRHYYRVLNQYSGPKAGRPERIRVGHGRYRMSLQGAELLCDFPSTSVLVSNVVWERADLGALRDLDQLYKSLGQSRAYAVTTRPNGSTLTLANVSPVDQGLYRCMATAMDPSTNAMFTLFQDIPFYPDFGAYRSRPEPHYYRPPPCCRSKDPLRVYPPPQTTLAIVPPQHHHHHYQHRQQSSSLVVNALSQY
ncbi:Hypothetical protein NTJ_15594 [Nesidiocoris tenuis]|uniref:Ig-like domain-containing protein n=1 Tax=Nesidiocoris tenuis TaxID=355587 RepID=A0ABN7BEH5_9HEMI|nr:Hypothetical protein NTJ_15594 [Nesidiocoris tenuis]